MIPGFHHDLVVYFVRTTSRPVQSVTFSYLKNKTKQKKALYIFKTTHHYQHTHFRRLILRQVSRQTH